VKACARLAVAGFALFFTRVSEAQSAVPVQLDWQAPPNCPQEAQVRQKLRDLLGTSANEGAPSRLRALGQIEPIGDRFRLTLNIHYDLVNATRVVNATSCEDLGGVAAVTLALLFRAEHSSSAPLTARDLGGPSSAAGAAGAESRTTAGAENGAAGGANSRSAVRSQDEATSASGRAASERDTATATATGTASEKRAADEQSSVAAAAATKHSSLQFAFRVPELRADIGVLPEPSYGIGLAAGLRYETWRVLVSGTFWRAQEYAPGAFVGYGAHFGRVSGELAGCRGFRFTNFELSPCLLLTLDDVAARGTGVGIASSNPRTAWISLGAGLQGLWFLNRGAALVFGINGRIATSKPRFVSESIGEISQIGPAALGAVLGCEWLL
jgi:hypothetical protein